MSLENLCKRFANQIYTFSRHLQRFCNGKSLSCKCWSSTARW